MPLDITLSCVLQAVLATLMTWAFTAAGAALVCFTARSCRTAMDGMMAAGAGVMLASSFWSLLSPGEALAQSLGQPVWLVISAGVLAGALLPEAGELLMRRASLPENTRRTRLLVTAITLHNIPEGLAVGMAFGACIAGAASLESAWLLAFGVAVQNFPEGAAVSLPLRRGGMPIRRACLSGALSGAVEPIAGLIGALLASQVESLLPFALCFAAGAMITVAATDLIPESRRSGRPFLMTLMTALGFAFMTVLDVALG